MSRVVVTGGAGYIGSHAVKALLEAGREVVVYDNLSAGHREAVARLSQRWPSRVSLVEGDIRDTDRVASVLSDSGAGAVMHFAAWLSVPGSVVDPAGYYSNNVGGALSVVQAMVHARVTRLVFSSTCAVFGEPDETPIPETHATRPVNAYGETKLAVERALPHYERAYGVRFVALRYFNAAGADQEGWLGEDHHPEIHIIPRAIEAARGGDRLKVFGTDYPTPDGTCLRDYIHVSDLADAHVEALAALEGGGASAVFNLGNGEPHSVLQVIKAVERATGRPVPFDLAPRRAGDPAALYAANGRIREALSWRPRFASLETIVETAWQWHSRHPRGYKSA